MERFREGLSAAATSGRAEQRWRASQGEGSGGRWWDDLSTVVTGRAGQRRRACCSERVVCSEGPRQSRMTTSVERLESDGPTSPVMNPDAWPTIQTSPEHTTRRSRRPGTWSSQEPGAGSPGRTNVTRSNDAEATTVTAAGGGDGSGEGGGGIDGGCGGGRGGRGCGGDDGSGDGDDDDGSGNGVAAAAVTGGVVETLTWSHGEG